VVQIIDGFMKKLFSTVVASPLLQILLPDPFSSIALPPAPASRPLQLQSDMLAQMRLLQELEFRLYELGFPEHGADGDFSD